MDPVLAEEFADKCDGHLDLIEAAWGVISNSGGGDWSRETDDWRTAAERWRDQYHALLKST